MRVKAMGALLILMAFSILQHLLPPTAQACVCGPYTVKDLLLDSDAVFAGKAVSVERVKQFRSDGWTYIDNIFVFEVTQAWKGVTATQITVVYPSDFTDPSGLVLMTDCDGDGFEVGGAYLVYAKGTNPDGVLEAQIDLSV